MTFSKLVASDKLGTDKVDCTILEQHFRYVFSIRLSAIYRKTKCLNLDKVKLIQQVVFCEFEENDKDYNYTKQGALKQVAYNYNAITLLLKTLDKNVQNYLKMLAFDNVVEFYKHLLYYYILDTYECFSINVDTELVKAEYNT